MTAWDLLLADVLQRPIVVRELPPPAPRLPKGYVPRARVNNNLADGTRICSRCLEALPIRHFGQYRRKSGLISYSAYCKLCKAEYTAEFKRSK